MTGLREEIEVVDNDPDIDYEYYDTRDFGDLMEAADKRGELYRGVGAGSADFAEFCRRLRELKAAKRAKTQEFPRPYPLPAYHPSEELCVAEDAGTEYR